MVCTFTFEKLFHFFIYNMDSHVFIGLEYIYILFCFLSVSIFNYTVAIMEKSRHALSFKQDRIFASYWTINMGIPN